MLTAKQKGRVIISITLIILVLRFFAPMDVETFISEIDETVVDNDSNSITLEMIITASMKNQARGASFTTSRCKEFEVYVDIVGVDFNITSESREECDEDKTTHFISENEEEEFEIKITVQFGEGVFAISLFHEASYHNLEYWLYVYNTTTADYTIFG